MRRAVSLFLCISLLTGLRPFTAHAAGGWPEDVGIEADGGILMDAATGAVLYGKNIHNTYYPASITKILTALIVIEQCGLDESVTFSRNAVYNVEADSSNAGLDEGDVLSVRDCLYAMLLKSANEAANALAEHTAGSIEDFARLMNEKAASLGCVDSHFSNPSGLNSEDHYTSAYDMALIGQAALQNETLMKIDSTLYYDLPVTRRNPEGLRIYPGHKMLKRNMPEYYEGCLGGKTGYTSLAGNTLITFAERDGLRLISVILNGHQSHYRDTKALLDFGFENFQTVSVLDFDRRYVSVENDMTIAGLPASPLSGLRLDPSGLLTLPKSGDFANVSSGLSYDLADDAPPDAIARVDYSWGDRRLGSAYLFIRTVSPDTAAADPATAATDLSADPAVPAGKTAAPDVPDRFPLHVPPVVWTVLGVLAAVAALAALFIAIRSYREKKELEARQLRRQKRMARLRDSKISPMEFDLTMERKRQNRDYSRRSRKRRRRSSHR